MSFYSLTTSDVVEMFQTGKTSFTEEIDSAATTLLIHHVDAVEKAIAKSDEVGN